MSIIVTNNGSVKKPNKPVKAESEKKEETKTTKKK